MPSWIQPPPGTIDIERLWDYFVADLWGYILAAITGNESDRLKYLGFLRWDFSMFWLYIQDWVALCVDALDDWVEDVVDWLTTNVDYALEWVSQAWQSLGYEIQAGLYTAVSWAEAKALEVYDALWAAIQSVADWGDASIAWVIAHGEQVWNWIRDWSARATVWLRDREARTWDWIYTKSDGVTAWIDLIGQPVRLWWETAHLPVDQWIKYYQLYYQWLYDNYREKLQALLEDPLKFSLEALLLSAVERWLYDRWFQQVK